MSIVILIISMSYGMFTVISTMRIHDPSFNLNQSHIEIAMPVYLENKGFLPVEITTNCSGSEEKITIPIGASGTFPIRLSTKTDLMHENLHVLITISIKPLISLSINMTIPSSFYQQWSPYQDFRLGEPSISMLNYTHLSLNVPISFRNLSPIFIRGSFLMTVYDEGKIVGYGETDVNVNPTSEYNGHINICLENPWTGSPNRIFEGVSKNYTILMSLPGVSVNQTKIVNWPPIIASTNVGSPTIAPYNSSHLFITTPISFENQAPFPINGTLKGKIVDYEGNIIGSLHDAKFNLQPGELYSTNMQGFLRITETKIKLILTMETPCGIIEREIP